MTVHPYTRFFILPSAPTVDEDETEGYEAGDVVLYDGSFYDCSDPSAGAAVWTQRAAGASFDLAAEIAAASSAAFTDDDLLVFRKDSDGTIRQLSGFDLSNYLTTSLFGVFADTTHDHQGGPSPKLDHGLALNGLTDDDHTQYQLKSLLTTLGDIIYATASSVWARLAGNTTTTRKFLRQTGNGSVSAAPAWDTLVAGDIPDISATYAVAAKGVTNGDTHDHTGGDGATLKAKSFSMTFLNGATVAASTTAHTAPNKTTVDATTNSIPFPYAGTLNNLTIRISSSQPSTGSLVVTMTVANVDTALVVTVPANSVQGSYSNTGTNVSIAAGALIKWKVVNNATSGSAAITAITMGYEIEVSP